MVPKVQPDISAPGVNIIASWSPLSLPVGEPHDGKRKDLYNIESGTSMACPHATGTAAYVKSFHRDWSPAMVMSALITTGTKTSYICLVTNHIDYSSQLLFVELVSCDMEKM